MNLHGLRNGFNLFQRRASPGSFQQTDVCAARYYCEGLLRQARGVA